ncbi:hypothetical protein LEP1GSC074_1992 [Leptospira noguchii str. Hook]|uniref:Uncharacterized protein n=1 Tax=Leptospira noguchii serovar Panama str. CZ214 TaxID=1001595 RepID=T0H2E7_9LEPT|nr:hypothetical protein LEP1GSC170_4908 [Leptospira interrogans serovar Bataviae str. HAI135]EMS85839.1 hypothetical protein LEP1GSC074_1992 [Leptospira noguchii str. Hook]EQA73561.1 hypothetical protein LEP1GSC059_0231 [Leptospira noguchii serovar Panama str. CZ214]
MPRKIRYEEDFKKSTIELVIKSRKSMTNYQKIWESLWNRFLKL